MKIKNIKLRFIFKKDVIVKTNKQIIWRNGKITFSIYRDAKKFINVIEKFTRNKTTKVGNGKII